MLNRLLRYFFYWPIRLTSNCNPVPFEPLKQLKIDKQKPICYLLTSSSLGNLLTLERLARRIGIPSPFDPLEVNGQKTRRYGYLRKPSLFTSKCKNTDVLPILQDWRAVAEKSGQDLQIIPVTVLWTRNPSYEGIALHGIEKPTSSLKKFITITFFGRDNCTILSYPLSLISFKAELEKRGHDKEKKEKLLHRYISLHFLKMARSVIGKPFPNRKLLIEELIKRKAVQTAIDVELINHREETRESLEQKARKIYEVMVADTRYPLLKFLNNVISLFWKHIYHGQTIIGADRVRKLVQSGHEIIYIPCHRSHMDYILLYYVIFHEGLPLPQIASGDNLNFFPVGPLIRRCGSYFIRRKMKGDNFYITLFGEYLSILFEKGMATEFFIEGGRSRTGRTLPPKTGMVAMTVKSQLRGIERPIAFIPTYLGYEHVSEVRSYMQELSGKAKKKESALQLLGIFKRMRYYGRGYVTFGKPVIVPRFLSKEVPNWRNDIDPSGTRIPGWLYSTVNSLSRRIIMNLNESATINGINLCALAIICDPDKTLSMRKLHNSVALLIRLLNADPKRRSFVPDSSIDTLISQGLELNKFRVYDVGEDMKFVRPSRGQTLQLTYFMNNIVHLFALPALIANIIISNGHIKREDIRIHARNLFYFLRHELFCPIEEDELDSLIEIYINSFISGEYIAEREGVIFLSGDGWEELYNLARSIRLNLIRYLVAVTALRKTDNGTITIDKFIEKCLIFAKRLPPSVTNEAPEFVDPILFRIMCSTFKRHNYFFINADKTININPEKVLKLARAAEPLISARDLKILQGSASEE